MKNQIKIVLITLFTTSMLYADQCSDILNESIEVSNKCLFQLELLERSKKKDVGDDLYVEFFKREIGRYYYLRNIPKYIIDYKMKSIDLTYKNGHLSDTELILKGMYRIPVQNLNVRMHPSPKSRIISVVQKNNIVSFTEVSHRVLYSGKGIAWIKIDIGWVYIFNFKKRIADTLLQKQSQLLLESKSNSKGGVKE